MIKNIDSIQNPLIKGATELLQKKYRDKEQAFLLEGIKNIQEALASDFIIEKIFLVKEKLALDVFEQIEQLAQLKKVQLITVSEKIIKKISDTNAPQPIVAVVQKPHFDLNKSQLKSKNFVVILDELQDPGNLGTIIRTADAAGVDVLCLTTDCVDLYSPKVVRSTMGSLFHLPIFVDCEKKELIDYLKNNDFTLYTTAADGKNDIFCTKFAEKAAVVIGNEAHGISEIFTKASDMKLSIPIKGKAESLNAAVAAALVLYQISKDI